MAGILLNRSRQAPAEDTPAFGGIAERFRRAGDLERAITLCRDGLKKFPDQLSARVTLGWSLLDKGQYEEARAELERVLRRAPDNLAAIRGLAELHDRSEGAMSSMEDHGEAWRPEPEVSEPAVQSSVAFPISTTGAAHNEDPFAPISLKFASTTTQAPPQVMHTAADAERVAQEAAIASAAMALLGVDRVELQGAAAAAMAASGAEDMSIDASASAPSAIASIPFIAAIGGERQGTFGDTISLDLDVMPFEAGADEPAVLEAGGASFHVMTAADGLRAASQADATADVHAAASAESDLAETEQLVASLQSFSMDDPAEGDLVIQVPAVSEPVDLSLELAAFEAPTTSESAFRFTPVSEVLPALDALVETTGDDSSFVDVQSSIVEDIAGVEQEEAEAMAAIAALHVETAASPMEIDPSTAAMAGEQSTIEGEALSTAWGFELVAPTAEDVAFAAEGGEAAVEPFPVETGEDAFGALSLFDIPELESEPAFVPDLAFALGQGDVDETEAVGAPLALAAAEPEFVPDLSEVMLTGEGMAALTSSPVSFESPVADVLADADLTASEAAFVPDLSAVALEESAATAVAEVVRLTGRVAEGKSALRALERFLSQVEYRRVQLAQGSVA
jgi:Tetratricopeptide repeat